MLRIIKDGKPLTLKQQKKLVKDDPTQNVGYLVDFTRPEKKPRPKYPGLRPAKVEESVSEEPKSHDLESMEWNDLLELASDLGVLKQGMTREDVEQAIRDTNNE